MCSTPLTLFMNKILIIALLLFCFIPSLRADEIQIPFSCYAKDLQKEFLERGYKLDLSGNDRTRDSWGFLKNEGSKYSLFTYASVTSEELNMISGS